MGGNPLLLAFLAIAGLLMAAGVGLVVMQRRVFREQSRQVQELLQEAREMSRSRPAGVEPGGGEPAGSGDNEPEVG